ncbi:hypothetical protein QFZ22_009795 [Streptomyces canus]|uniref:Uncharacterized protein n=1 Tax=Streptomyces canus TaxID=58343 RepID=A0AAW8FUR5_9ACTN|nr:hypothetical protein [Streptomyces canus]
MRTRACSPGSRRRMAAGSTVRAPGTVTCTDTSSPARTAAVPALTTVASTLWAPVDVRSEFVEWASRRISARPGATGWRESANTCSEVWFGSGAWVVGKGDGDRVALRIDPYLRCADADAVVVFRAARTVAVRRRQRTARRVPVGSGEAGRRGRTVRVVHRRLARGVAVAPRGEEGRPPCSGPWAGRCADRARRRCSWRLRPRTGRRRERRPPPPGPPGVPRPGTCSRSRRSRRLARRRCRCRRCRRGCRGGRETGAGTGAHVRLCSVTA